MNQSKIFLILILIILLIIAFYAFLENSDLFYLKKISQQIDQKIVSPLKQFSNFLKHKFFPNQESLKNKSEKIIEKTQQKLEQTIEEKQEEAEQKAKEQAKKQAGLWFSSKVDSLEQVLNPLKIKIQQGSGWLREGAGQIKDFFVK